MAGLGLGVCVVCTHHLIPEDKSRSFHRFPSKHEPRQKWLDVLGLKKITTKSRVCSDHFDISCYHDTDGYTSLRRLKSTAIPTLRLRNEADVNSQDVLGDGPPIDANSTSAVPDEAQRREVTDNTQGVTQGSPIRDSTTSPTNTIAMDHPGVATQELPTSASTSTTTTNATAPNEGDTLGDGLGQGSIPVRPPTNKKKPTRKLLKRDIAPVFHDNASGESGVDSSSEESSNELNSDGSRILKRKHSDDVVNRVPEKKNRMRMKMSAYKWVEFHEDMFKNPEDFQNLLETMRYKDRLITTYRLKSNKYARKNTFLKEMVSSLQQRDAHAAAEYLKVYDPLFD